RGRPYSATLLDRPRPSPTPMRRQTPILSAVIALFLGACTTPEKALYFADSEASQAIACKQAQVFGHSQPYDVRVPTDRVRDATGDPVTGLASRPTPLDVTLAGSLELAARNSRNYQTQKENLYKAALTLVTEKVAFRPSPFLNLSSDITKDGNTISV